MNSISAFGLHWMGSRGEVGDHKINVPWKDGLDPLFLFLFLLNVNIRVDTKMGDE